MIVDLFTSVAGCLNVKEFAGGFIRKSWENYKEKLEKILSLNYSLTKIAFVSYGSCEKFDAFDCIADRNYCLYKRRRFKTVKPISPPHEEEPPRKKSKLVDG